MDPPGELRFLIVGMARSGTTLVQRLACELADVWVPPETHFWSVALRNDLEPVLDPEDASALLREVLAAMDLPEPQADVDVLVDGVAGGLRPYALFESLVRSLSPARPVLGEKTPNHLVVAGQLGVVHPELRVVATVRDPRAVHLSQQEAPWGIDDPMRNAWRWRLRYQLVDELAQVLADRMLVLRYEDVVSSPAEATRERLADFLDVDHRVVPLTDRVHLFPTRESWKSRALDDFDPARVDRWRDELEPEAARAVWGIAGDLASRWGYEGSGPAAAVGSDARAYLSDVRSLTAPLHVDGRIFQ